MKIGRTIVIGMGGEIDTTCFGTFYVTNSIFGSSNIYGCRIRCMLANDGGNRIKIGANGIR